jgi:diguanylate cyclase (GGDEF)-like protein
MCALSGFSEGELIGASPRLLSSRQQDRLFYLNMWETILAGRPWQGELVEQKKDGGLYSVNQVITPLVDPSGHITHFVAIQHEIAPQPPEHAQMRWLAYHDPLTGLPNRVLFFELFNQAIQFAGQQGNKLTVMLLDLDHFKAVNDTYGHEVGDQLLAAVGERLNSAVRKTDVVARLSGDEFTILVTNLDESGDAEPIASQVIATFQSPFMIGGRAISIHVSLGASQFPQDGESAEDLLRKADEAMYRAKAGGRNTYMFWSRMI